MTQPINPRPYKNFTPKMGIYRVVHRPSGRTQLGWSPHLDGALNRIRFQLTAHLHPLAAMQRDWNQDGPEAFSFEIVDELKPGTPGEDPSDDLKALLALWKDQLALGPKQRY